MSWKIVCIKDISLRITKGTTPTSLGMGFAQSGINFIKAGALNGDVLLNEESFAFISKDTHNKLKRSQLEYNDVLITIAGENIGKCGLVRSFHLPANTNQAVGIIKLDKEKVDSKFVYYFFKQSNTFNYIQSSNAQAAQPNINLTSLGLIKINLPPLPIQQKIAKILSNYDDLIENNLKRIKLLEESARLTYEEWFLRFRVDGKRLEINPESGLPFGWENKSVTECDTFKQDKRKVKEFEGEKKYYATANISETEIIADGEIISWDSKPSRAQIKPNNNTVWFARMSNTYKVLCFNKKNINLQDNSVLSSGFAGFKAKNDLCLPFLYFTINSTFFHELKDLYATGATQVSLNNDSMSFIKIIEPSANLAEEFGSRTLPLIEEISILRSKNQLLKEARNILLPRLMTGMIDTNDMSIAV